MQTLATSEKSKNTSSASMPKSKQQPFFSPVKVQPRLTIGAVDDSYEREADAMADKVMRMPDYSAGQNLFFKPTISSVQRKCTRCEEEEKIRKKSNDINGGIEAPSTVSDVLNSGGQPLDRNTRNFFEPRFGHDFSNVKIHTGSKAAKSSDEIHAHAYTLGKNIVFNSSKYSPETEDGKRLLAHELTHVVQQKTGIATKIIQRDFAVDLPNPEAATAELTEEQVADSIRFNTRRFNLRDEWEISQVRDVLGLDRLPAVVDEELVNAIAQFQAENNITPDGKIGPVTASRLSRELFHESENLPLADKRELLQSSRRMGTRALRIRVNQPAVNLDNLGSANYGVMWDIADQSANGFVIQHVLITSNLFDCAGNPVAMNGFAGNRDYWEVWRVVNGRVRCGTLSVACAGSDDTFTTIAQNAGTRGTVTERGQVSYYPDYLIDPAWITGIVHPAGDLPHRATRPPFWNEGETMRHQMIVTYNDCVRPATSSVVSTP